MRRHNTSSFYLILICFLLVTELSIAQGNAVDKDTESASATNEKISFETILNRLINGPDSLIVYRNTSIDLGNYSLRKIDRLFAQANIDAGFLILNKSLEFHNCRISGKGLTDLKLISIIFKDCIKDKKT